MTSEELHKIIDKAPAKRTENKKFFTKLKKVKPKALDAAFHTEHELAFEQINCLNCANCCKTTGPLFTNTDIDRLSKHFKISTAQFIEQYLRVDEEGDFVLQQVPCPFLDSDNYCGVYEVRPKACREYPHTDRNKMHQILRLTQKNAELCPAVYTLVERLKEKF
jgi:Fe-S-cluster containining protein